MAENSHRKFTGEFKKQVPKRQQKQGLRRASHDIMLVATLTKRRTLLMSRKDCTTKLTKSQHLNYGKICNENYQVKLSKLTK